MRRKSKERYVTICRVCNDYVDNEVSPDYIYYHTEHFAVFDKVRGVMFTVDPSLTMLGPNEVENCVKGVRL